MPIETNQISIAKYSFIPLKKILSPLKEQGTPSFLSNEIKLQFLPEISILKIFNLGNVQKHSVFLTAFGR